MRERYANSTDIVPRGDSSVFCRRMLQRSRGLGFHSVREFEERRREEIEGRKEGD